MKPQTFKELLRNRPNLDRRQLNFLRWVVCICFVLGIVICMTYNMVLGSLTTALWLYIMGGLGLRGREDPLHFSYRLLSGFWIVLVTGFTTAMPWLIFGGQEECREAHGDMRTIWNRTFDDQWLELRIRLVCNWLLAAFAVFMAVTKHPPSAYIRQSCKCVWYIWLGKLVLSMSTMVDACVTRDLDEDGFRDQSSQHGVLGRLTAPFGIASGFLSDIWCLQLVVERLFALEDAFGEPLLCMFPAAWLSRWLILCIASIAPAHLISGEAVMGMAIVISFCVCLATVFFWNSYSRPLDALKMAQEADERRGGEIKKEIQKETRFAVEVLHNTRLGVLFATFTMAMSCFTYGMSSWTTTKLWSNIHRIAAMVDAFSITICTLLLSGVVRASFANCRNMLPRRRPPRETSAALQQENLCTCGRSKPSPSGTMQLLQNGVDKFRGGTSTDLQPPPCDRCQWDATVADLAARRISARALLSFYFRLGVDGTAMPDFDPERSSTSDVVWRAIIPQSRCGDQGKALAEVLETQRLDRPPRMVTHHWANNFRDLTAAVLADALGLKRWDGIAEKLTAGDTEELVQQLWTRGSLHWQYWICAACINQHASICNNFMGARDSVTGELMPSCDCKTPKRFSDQPILCEVNKFDEMMGFLHRSYKRDFLQVVAIDKGFNMFSRAWCVAELVEADSNNLEQHVILHSPQVLENNADRLCSLQVQDCEASNPEDKDHILAKIGSEAAVAKFNERLHSLLLGSGGLLADWLDGQKLLQEVGAIAARAKARCEKKGSLSGTPPDP